MSAQSAKVYDFPHCKRAPEAQPVRQLQVLKHVRQLILQEPGTDERRRLREDAKRMGQPAPVFLTLAALSVVEYFCEITDKDQGDAMVELATIAKRIGRSRSTVIRQVQRLVELSVIERDSRRQGKRCFASGYRLVDPGSRKGAIDDTEMTRTRSTDEPTPVHQRTTYARAFQESFPNGVHPYGPEGGSVRGGAPPNETDWIEIGEWLACRAELRRRRPGPGEAYLLAKQYLDRWRQCSGDRRVLGAIRHSKCRRGGKGWFGDYLIDRLEEMLGNT